MTKKAKKVPFDAKVFLATTNGGRSLSDYRRDKVIFSQGDQSEGKKLSLRSWVPTNSAERAA
jgi:hypothetical protein